MLRSLFCGSCCGSSVEDVRVMDYSHSLLHEVPSDVFLCERTLETLYLDSNHIVELPRQLFNCDELRTLNLSDNEINFLPPAISSLINVQKLDLSKNALTTLPDNIRSCSNLSYLDLSVNPLEKFPESLINLISINELYLTDVYLEFLPANFGKLVNLRILELRENNLVTLPKTMSRLVHLTRLDIGNNEFTELPEVVSSLHNLTELWIDGNHIRRLSPTIGHLRKMIHFEACNNNIEVLPRDIGYWTRVVEFSVSNNDISQLPTTIGNMKNLVGLKLDDNSLKSLPDTLGKLTNLEELMLTHNYLHHLPSSIGLLRKLHVLTVDKNLLSDIPPELGSCTSLSILSLRGNRISEVPAEIGHLSGLRVLNLVDNHLRYLPMSLLKLDKLSALWLSTNQSQPLVPLQQELNTEMYQTVLTCFMLPQLAHKKSVEHVKEEPNVLPRPTHHKHICFATDTGVTIEQPGRLTRAPTPYPKELRALAKHAKNVQRGLTVSQHRQGEKIIQPIQGPVQIKEAKVTVTPHNTFIEQESTSSSADLRSVIRDVGDVTMTAAPTCKPFYDTKQGTSDACVMPQPVLAFDSSPVIREAKNIRTDSQTQPATLPAPNTSVGNNMTPQMVKNDIKPAGTPQPPPYHIAAAYSLQAQFFNSLDCSPAENVALSPTECSETYNLNETYSLGPMTCDNDNIKTIDNENNFNDLREIENKTNDNLEDDISQTEYRPRTFIQDKPLPGQNIVAPTPKRPHGSEKPSKIPYLTSSPSLRRSPGFVRSDASMRSYDVTSLSHVPTSPRSSRHETSATVNNNMSRKSSRTKIPTPSKTYSNASDSGTTKWVFGQHKNATVVQVTVNKNPDLGFTISENDGKGIYVEQVTRGDVLKVGDKILEVEGVDFTKLSKAEATEVFNTCGQSISMMVSHMY